LGRIEAVWSTVGKWFRYDGCYGTVVAVAVLIGRYTASPSYAKVAKFESPFESSAIPLCGIEEGVFSGIQKFSLHKTTKSDGTTRQSLHMNYHHTRGEGITSGTQYIVHENDRQGIVDEQNSDRIITQIKGSFIGKGNAEFTLLNIRTITILHDNGDIETIVDRIDIKFNEV